MGTQPHVETIMRRRLLHPRRTLALATALTVVAAGLATALSAVDADAAAPQASTSAAITVSGVASGHSLPADFAGFSLEADSLSNGDFKSTDFADYLKALGPTGLIRIGGNSADETFWTSTGQTPPSWSEGTITPASLTDLATAISGTGWKVILAVNLKQFSTSRAADEAVHAEQILGSALAAIEIGNEANYYYTSDATYFSNFESYAAAIKQAVPGIGIVGPDAGHDQPAFVAAFAQNEAASPDITMVTDHEYPLSDCNGATNTIADLLSTSSVTTEAAAADSVVAAGVTDKVPGIMDETNSITCGGQAGVSDVYASALWALDYTLLLAQHGVRGADFHGGISGCGPYSPLCTSGSSTNLTAQPLFYGLLAADQVGTGSFLNVTNPDSANLRTYAVQNGSGLTVVLDDVQDPNSYGATNVTLTLPQSYTGAESTVLAASSSAGLSATSGITLGGQQISSTGVLPSPTYTAVPVSGDTVTVAVAAGSATILKLSGGSGSPSTTFTGGLSGKCLSVTGSAVTNGATAEIYTCNGSPSETWTVGPNSEIVGGLSGKCLEVAGGSTANYAGVDISTCTGATDQQWTVNSGGTIVGTQSGKCLSVTGSAVTNGATAEIYTCNGSPSETWTE
jgi:Ricin-type beta-trefoil lectin domain